MNRESFSVVSTEELRKDVIIYKVYKLFGLIFILCMIYLDIKLYF